MKFYITEKSDSASTRKWEPCNATDLTQAKRIATRKQMFQGTVVAVAVKLSDDLGGGYEQVAYKQNGEWVTHCLGKI